MFQISSSMVDGKLEVKLEAICSVCHQPLDESKCVPDYEVGEVLPEVVVHTTPIHEYGGGNNRYYHGVCWLEEQREMADDMAAWLRENPAASY